jgi:hypothetical protein
VDAFSSLLVEDHRFLGRITEHTGDVVREVGHYDVFLKFCWVNLRGWLDINLSLGGLGDPQGPPQDPVNPDKESVIRTGMVSRSILIRKAQSFTHWSHGPGIQIVQALHQ